METLLGKLDYLRPEIQEELAKHTAIMVELENVTCHEKLPTEAIDLIKKNTNLLEESSPSRYQKMTLIFTRAVSGQYFLHLEAISEEDVESVHLNTIVLSADDFNNFLAALLLASKKFAFKLRKNQRFEKFLKLS